MPRRAAELEALTLLVKEVKEYRAREMPVDPELGDLSALPPELVKELNLSTPSELEQRIVAIIKSAGGKANINTILVELYNRHKIVQKRRNMQNKLWRMMDQKLIYGVEGEKGVYQLDEPKLASSKVDLSTTENQAKMGEPDWDVPF